MLGALRPLLPEILDQPAIRWSEIADFELMFARNASTVKPSKESPINADRKSTTRFKINLSTRCLNGGQKRKTAVSV